MIRAWLRSIADAVLGRVPGKPGRFDTATRMAMDADFSDRDTPAPTRRETPPDVDPIDPLAELVRIVEKRP